MCRTLSAINVYVMLELHFPHTLTIVFINHATTEKQVFLYFLNLI